MKVREKRWVIFFNFKDGFSKHFSIVLEVYIGSSCSSPSLSYSFFIRYHKYLQVFTVFDAFSLTLYKKHNFNKIEFFPS